MLRVELGVRKRALAGKVPATAAALGVREAPDRSPTKALVEHLKGRRALLILDNCEHLVEACAVVVLLAFRTGSIAGVDLLWTGYRPATVPVQEVVV